MGLVYLFIDAERPTITYNPTDTFRQGIDILYSVTLMSLIFIGA